MEILDGIGMMENFDNQAICDINECRNRLGILMEEEVVQEIRIKPKLRTYVKFKTNVQAEDYLFTYIGKSKRSLFSQLRCGILPLTIETGRFNIKRDVETGQMRKLKPEERLCPFCNNNDIEDEIHFVMICPLYDGIRERQFRCIPELNDLDNMTLDDKFAYLMKNYWRSCLNYINDAWNLRKKCLYNRQ